MAESSDFRTLKILDRFRPIIAKTGADYDVLRLILRVKFQMDQRRVPTVLSARNGNKEQKEGNLYLRSLWLYALMGLIMVPFVVWDTGHYMLQMGLVTAMLMFMIMTSMISDFSSVLLDIRDRNIIMTKPVNGRTVGLARAIHAGVYLLLLTGSLTAAPLVAGLIAHGIAFFLLFLVELVLMNMLILVTTSLIYLLLMFEWGPTSCLFFLGFRLLSGLATPRWVASSAGTSHTTALPPPYGRPETADL
jgi:hypothetical protein